MAVDNTAFTPTLKRFPYISFGPPEVWNTPIPRGEAIFTLFGDTIAAPSAADSQSFTITCTLPSSFAYVMMECSIMFSDTEVGDAADWDSAFRCYLTDDVSNGTWLSCPIMNGSQLWSTSAILKGRSYQVTEVPRKLILPLNDVGRLQVEGQNTSADGGPVSIFFLAKFLEFDLNQAHMFSINTPVPVR